MTSLNELHVDKLKQDPKKVELLRQAQTEIWSRMPESTRNLFYQHKGRQSCIRQAMAKPLPGASADAFIKGATRIDGETVREVLPVHIAALQAVDSPLLQMVQKATESTDKKSNSDFTEQQQWDAAYIFTCEPKFLRKILKDGGKESVQLLAEEKCCDWTAAKLNFVILAVVEQFNRHVQTAVKYAAELEGQAPAFFQALTETKPAA